MRVLKQVLSRSKIPFTVLNITQLSEYRKDAHTAIYKKQWNKLTEEQLANPRSYADCVHWCLPGLQDTWNELLYAKLFYPQQKTQLLRENSQCTKILLICSIGQKINGGYKIVNFFIVHSVKCLTTLHKFQLRQECRFSLRFWPNSSSNYSYRGLSLDHCQSSGIRQKYSTQNMHVYYSSIIVFFLMYNQRLVVDDPYLSVAQCTY